MKKIIYILIAIVFFTSCEDVIDIEVPSGEPRLVIDASLEFAKEPDSAGGLKLEENEIKLSRSTPFFDQNPSLVSGATVFITNTTFDLVINFEESNFEPGTYTPSDGSTFWDFDSDYELTIIDNDQTYTATTKIIPTVPFDDITQGDGALFDGDETEIVISFTDDGNRENFYLFDFDFNLFLASEDRFYQGQKFNFSYFYEDMVVGQNIRIKILGIDKRYFEYSELIIDQSEQEGGNPFRTPPAVLRGNISNISDPNNFPLGYFNLSETDSFDITIQ